MLYGEHPEDLDDLDDDDFDDDDAVDWLDAEATPINWPVFIGALCVAFALLAILALA